MASPCAVASKIKLRSEILHVSCVKLRAMYLLKHSQMPELNSNGGDMGGRTRASGRGGTESEMAGGSMEVQRCRSPSGWPMGRFGILMPG